MTDTGPEGRSVELAWLSFGRAVAVAAGALTALVGLLFDVPVPIATLRGALALCGISLFVRAVGYGLRALAARERSASAAARASPATSPRTPPAASPPGPRTHRATRGTT